MRQRYCDFSGRLLSSDYQEFFPKFREKRRCIFCKNGTETIASHSIGHNSWFKFIERGSQRQVLHSDVFDIDDYKPDHFAQYLGLNFISVGDASTFYSLCSKCDQMFAPIDRFIDPHTITPQQIALMGLRSSIHEQYRCDLQTSTDLVKTELCHNVLLYSDYREKVKSQILFYKNCIDNQNYDQIHYDITQCEFDYLVYSDLIEIYYKSPIIWLPNSTSPFFLVSVTVAPNSNGLNFLYVSYPQKYYDPARPVPQINLGKIINGNNWFLDIDWWDKQSHQTRQDIRATSIINHQISYFLNNRPHTKLVVPR